MGSADGAGGEDAVRVEFAPSDRGELGDLSRWLAGRGAARVERTSVPPVPGELGAGDILAAMGSSGAVVAAIQVLPGFIRSRHPSFRIEATVKGERFVLDAKNADEQVKRMAERILDAVIGE